MRNRTWVVIAFVAAVGCGKAAKGPTGPTGATSDASAASANVASTSATGIGPLDEQLDGTAVVKVLGEPASRTEVTMYEETGQWVSTWSWPAQGIVLDMAAPESDGKDAVPAIRFATVTAPSKFQTQKGIGIGSPEQAVLDAYGALHVPGKTAHELAFTIEGGKVSAITTGKLEQ